MVDEGILVEPFRYLDKSCPRIWSGSHKSPEEGISNWNSHMVNMVLSVSSMKNYTGLNWTRLLVVPVRIKIFPGLVAEAPNAIMPWVRAGLEETQESCGYSICNAELYVWRMQCDGEIIDKSRVTVKQVVSAKFVCSENISHTTTEACFILCFFLRNSLQ